MPAAVEVEAKEPNKLILCFDGTGNTFSGSNADTNVVKLLNKLDRHHPKQFHYYQTGVGTYDIYETMSVHKTAWGQFRSSISRTLDQALGTTFDAHVMAGYRFLMRYYSPGDKIYMFGFSRGAFTARFLARMINRVGLLCKGNEEMVPFAYRLYQRYLAGEVADYELSISKPQTNDGTEEQDGLLDDECSDEDEYHSNTYESARNEIAAFGNTFCRKELKDVGGYTREVNVKVYFLGIWDCVNSVAVLESGAPLPKPVMGNADYVRHAVAVDERRVKFKPALIAQDVRGSSSAEDVKEVWFPGCHGDVGGGWPATEEDNHDEEVVKLSLWQRIKNFWTTTKPKEASRDVRRDAFQMSDVALSWMIHELELVGDMDLKAAVKWSHNVKGYKKAFSKDLSQKQALKGYIHDSLRFGTGTGFFTVLLWRFMEILPTITRWELKGNEWEKVRFPLNNSDYRDIPRDAVLHQSLVYRLQNISGYCPRNNHGGSLPPCLKDKGVVSGFEPVQNSSNSRADPNHQTYQFAEFVAALRETAARAS